MIETENKTGTGSKEFYVNLFKDDTLSEHERNGWGESNKGEPGLKSALFMLKFVFDASIESQVHDYGCGTCFLYSEMRRCFGISKDNYLGLDNNEVAIQDALDCDVNAKLYDFIEESPASICTEDRDYYAVINGSFNCPFSIETVCNTLREMTKYYRMIFLYMFDESLCTYTDPNFTYITEDIIRREVLEKAEDRDLLEMQSAQFRDTYHSFFIISKNKK